MIAVMCGCSRSSPKQEAPPVAVADFRARFPEFETNSDEQVETALADAKPWNGFSAWGASYVQGVCTLAAHILAIANQRAAGNGSRPSTGIIRQATSKKAGALSTTYGNWTGYGSGATNAPVWLALTSYGLQWYSMARVRGMGAAIVPNDLPYQAGDVDWTRQRP